MFENGVDGDEGGLVVAKHANSKSDLHDHKLPRADCLRFRKGFYPYAWVDAFWTTCLLALPPTYMYLLLTYASHNDDDYKHAINAYKAFKGQTAHVDRVSYLHSDVL